MTKCPKCAKEVAVLKEWDYGPNSRDRSNVIHHVILYHCSCGTNFREYISGKTGKITTVVYK